MFRRKNTKSNISDEQSDNVSLTDSQTEETTSSTNNGTYMTPEKRKEILKEIFDVPKNPKIELKSQLLTDPKGILSEYLPHIQKFLEWSVLFFLGYFGFSYAWIITFALLYFSRNFSRPSSMEGVPVRHEKQVLKSQLEYLPSWVIFPDVERVEWINTIIKKVWPHIGQISQQIAKRLVEPKVKEILNRMRLDELSNFRLKNFHLGSIPARVGGIRVYDRNTGRDEIVVDVDIMYQGDACVEFTVQSFGCEINKVSFRGVARLTIKPLMETIPLFGGFELYFMEMPEFDYSLGKMANLAELPGVSNIIKSVLDNIIRRGFVWPNRFNFYFPVDSVNNLRNQCFAMPSPQGILHVIVHRGRHLMKKDKHLIGGKSDPYAVLAIGEKKISFKDRYAESTVDPEWNYVADFPVEEVAGLDLKLEFFDYDSSSEDDFLGRTSILIESALDGQIKERWVRLDDAKHGEVQLTLSWRPVIPASIGGDPCECCVVAIYADYCKNLSSGKSSAPFSKVELSMSAPTSEKVASSPLSRKESMKWIPSSKYEAYTTKARGPSEDPVFQEGHFFLCRNPSSDGIAVQVVDHRSGFVLGSTYVKINYIIGLPDKQFSRMEWKLKNSVHPEATIVLSAKLYACI